MNHWIFFPLVMTVLGLAMEIGGIPAENGPGLLLWAACGLIPISYFLIRSFVERFWLFAFCHGAVIVGTVFFASRSGYMICVVCAAAYTIYSFMLRLRENTSVYSGAIHPVTATVIFAAANFLFHKQKSAPDWDKYFVFTLIGVLACYLIIYYLKHYLSFLLVNKSSAGYLPAKEILHSGIGFVLPYTLIGVLILILSLNVKWLEPILHILDEVLKALLMLIIWILPEGGDTEEPLISTNQRPTADSGAILPPGETFWLWEVLEYVAIVLFVCGCAYVLFKASIKLVRFLQSQFGSRAEKSLISADEKNVFDVREKCNIAKKDSSTKKAGLFQRFTPAERIRRLYKKRVLSGKAAAEDRASLNYMTAKECGDLLSLPHMAELYEYVRYSGREATAEDVKQMKHACTPHSAP